MPLKNERFKVYIKHGINKFVRAKNETVPTVNE